jgi:hypothetical protein
MVSYAAYQGYGGSGGNVFDVTVEDRKTGETLKFGDSMISERLLEIYHGYPQLEIWGRGGGGTYARLLYRVEHGRYIWIRADQFDMNITRAVRKNITTTLPGGRGTIYYTGTMYPEPIEQ